VGNETKRDACRDQFGDENGEECDRERPQEPFCVVGSIRFLQFAVGWEWELHDSVLREVQLLLLGETREVEKSNDELDKHDEQIQEDHADDDIVELCALEDVA
jgi:hypothetical protein